MVYRLFVGIDVSKDVSSARGLTRRGKRCLSVSFTMDSAGFTELLKTLKTHCKDLPQVIVAMESTGCCR